MYQYDDYINLENSLDLPTEIRGKCVRVVSVLENLEDIVIVHKFKLYEVGSFMGNITQKDGEPYLHMHITIGDPEKNEVHSGHLNKAVIGATSEIFVTVFDEKIGRKLDEKTGINIFDFEK